MNNNMNAIETPPRFEREVESHRLAKLSTNPTYRDNPIGQSINSTISLKFFK